MDAISIVGIDLVVLFALATAGVFVVSPALIPNSQTQISSLRPSSVADHKIHQKYQPLRSPSRRKGRKQLKTHLQSLKQVYYAKNGHTPPDVVVARPLSF